MGEALECGGQKLMRLIELERWNPVTDPELRTKRCCRNGAAQPPKPNRHMARQGCKICIRRCLVPTIGRAAFACDWFHECACALDAWTNLRQSAIAGFAASDLLGRVMGSLIGGRGGAGRHGSNEPAPHRLCPEKETSMSAIRRGHRKRARCLCLDVG